MKVTVLLILPLVLFSCHKNKLDDDSAFLVGTWKTDYIVKRTYNSYIPYSTFKYDTILFLDHEYLIEFKKNGQVSIFTDGVLAYKNKLDRSSGFFESDTSCFSGASSGYSYHYKTQDHRSFGGCVNNIKLIYQTEDFPWSISSKYPYTTNWYIHHCSKID